MSEIAEAVSILEERLGNERRIGNAKALCKVGEAFANADLKQMRKRLKRNSTDFVQRFVFIHG